MMVNFAGIAAMFAAGTPTGMRLAMWWSSRDEWEADGGSGLVGAIGPVPGVAGQGAATLV